jgi:hypothetical protein
VVLEASVTHEDPGEIVGSNAWFVNALFKEHLTADEIAADVVAEMLAKPGDSLSVDQPILRFQ